VICFEFLQRPENVLAGYGRWSDYRSQAAPDAIRIEHHKTGANVLHPLIDPKDGSPLYPDAEAVLASVPKRGIPLVLKARRDGTSAPYTAMQMAKIVRKVCARAGLSKSFTLDACRHGGMTELEEAGLVRARVVCASVQGIRGLRQADLEKGSRRDRAPTGACPGGR
jgi:hypothetical protein